MPNAAKKFDCDVILPKVLFDRVGEALKRN